MDLLAVSNFRAALTGIDQSKSYISLADEKFTRVDKKENKILNTAQIAHFAKEAFQVIQTTNGNYLEKAKSYRELADSLSDYLSRLNSSKTIWQRIAGFFVYGSSEEKEIATTCSMLNRQASTLESKDFWAKEVISDVIACGERRFEEDRTQLKLLYLSLLDSSTLVIPKLDGLDPMVVSIWLLRHLQAFRASIDTTHPKCALLDEILKEVEERHSLVAIERALISFPREASLDWSEQEVLVKFQNLKMPGNEVAFHGGYRRYKGSEEDSGHAVEYLVRLEEGGTYCFTIVNSGEGTEYSAPFRDTAMNILNAFRGKRERMHTANDIWKQIPREAINQEFVDLLVQSRTSIRPTNMAEIKQQIERYFSRYKSVTYERGREHKEQLKGSCAIKSITAWLHERMGEALFREFKAFYSERDLNKLDHALCQIQDPCLRQTFKEEAYKIVRKRAEKHAKALKREQVSETKGFFNWLSGG